MFAGVVVGSIRYYVETTADPDIYFQHKAKYTGEINHHNCSTGTVWETLTNQSLSDSADTCLINLNELSSYNDFLGNECLLLF